MVRGGATPLAVVSDNEKRKFTDTISGGGGKRFKVDKEEMTLTTPDPGTSP